MMHFVTEKDYTVYGHECFSFTLPGVWCVLITHTVVFYGKISQSYRP